MGRASARSQRISQLAKERHNGAQGFVANSADSSTSSSSEDESGVSINDALSFSEGHSLPGRAPTTGDSRAQKYRKLKLDKEAAVLMNSSPKIDSFFRLSSSNVSSPQTLAATSPLFTIEEAIVQLNSDCDIGKAISDNVSITPFELDRRKAVRIYLNALKQGRGKMESSLSVAKMLFNKGPYMATCIREWADEYLDVGDLLHHQQGAHSKVPSLFDNSEFSALCKDWLVGSKPELRSPLALKKFVEGTVLPQLAVEKKSFSETSAKVYLKNWGYMFKQYKKGVYMDGHERLDVVSYREEWVSRMQEHEKRMAFYEGEQNEITRMPVLAPGEKQIVMVAHDECAMHAHDAKGTLWMTEHEQLLGKKGDGKAFMVSGFICPCHGFVDRKQADGYWTNVHMGNQLERAILFLNRSIPIVLVCFVLTILPITALMLETHWW